MKSDALDPYQILGLQPTASTEEVTAAYRAAAQAEHPDKGGSVERMAEINVAYELLSDPQWRVRFDRDRALLRLQGDPALDLIKAGIAGKSTPQIAQMRRDIAAHVRDLEPQLATPGTIAALTQRVGQEHAEREAVRLKRHRRELEYLDALLSSVDPILAAQAAA